MSKTNILTIGVSIASGALLATWLLTGTRKEKTKQIIAKSSTSIKNNLHKMRMDYDDSEIHYV